MNAKDIQFKIEQYTIEKSNFEDSRNYVSLSGISDDEDVIITRYKKGYFANKEQRLKCYKGYQMEADLINRLKNIFGNDLDIANKEIVAVPNLVKGHADGFIFGYPLDCKSVLMDDWIPDSKLPRKVYWQMQSYILYSKSNRGYVIYESRENGKLKVFDVYPNKVIQDEIAEKIERIIKAIKLS